VTHQEEALNYQVIEPSALPAPHAAKAEEMKTASRGQTYVAHAGKRLFVILALGERNTGGYQIEVHEVVQKGNLVLIRAQEKTPKPDGFVSQVITHPMLVLSVETNGKVDDVKVEWIK
jgi:PrcB C-terminal